MRLTAVVLTLILAVTGIAKGANQGGKESTVTGACPSQAVCMAHVKRHGSVSAKKAGLAACVTKLDLLIRTHDAVEDAVVGSVRMRVETKERREKQAERNTRLCSSRPCAGNATCIETGEGGYMCICPLSYTGENCHLKRGLCLTNGSPCQNGGTCLDADGSAGYSSCLCPPGFSGDFCEISVDSCQPNPCLNGGNCTNHGLAFTCVCPLGFTGFTCNDTTSLSPCASRPCANRGTCVGQPDGTFRCVCQKWFTGPTCSLQHRPKARSKLVGARPVDHRVFALTPQHYSLPAHTFHKLLRPPERDLLKITLKETVHSPGILVTHGQLVCFGMLALLTCMVILGTTGIVFFGRCETWLANAKYSQLVRQQREHLLREAGGASQEEPEHSVNIILPEKIRLTSFGRHYTSI
ncbi:hypothetical protein FQN60_008850 [Etheostoma spectabile]|uniref:EGF-like domain-containing protein n=1 Tax=Etheostoma spectabile TaxID=54343 RepID=A0A5J5CNX9_9PERO|nr:hypothetical protein FQN60_008850 [Etheostoma spectabile]